MNYSLYILKQFKVTTVLISIVMMGLYLSLEHTDFWVEFSFSLVLLSLYFLSYGGQKSFMFNSFWIIGNAGSWVLVYFFYRSLFEPISPYDYFRPYLLNVFLLAIFFVNGLFSLLPSISFEFSLQKNKALLYISIIIICAYVMSNGLKARELGVNYAAQFNAFYYVQAFLFLLLLSSMIAGYFFGLNAYFLVFLAIVGISLLGNHRGQLIINVAFFLFGLSLNPHKSKGFKLRTLLISLVFVSCTFWYIGEARLNRVKDNAQDLTTSKFNLERVIEKSGQVVIDQVFQRKEFDGFEHFSRIFTMPFPAFLLNGKPNNEDCNEVLNEKFGYTNLGIKASIPIPFIADAYRRLGVFGVFLFTVIIAFFYNTLFRIIASQHSNWQIPLMALVAISAIKIYPSSVLGTLSFFFYVIFKLFIIVYLLFKRRTT